jgi:signal peptidase II
MHRIIHIILLILILLGCLGCDWGTKYWASTSVQNEPPITIIPTLLELRYTENENLGFSMLKSVAYPWKDVIIYGTGVLALLFMIALLVVFRRDSIWYHIPLIVVMAGAIGNRLERLYNGFVVDFIHLHYAKHFSWPIFNIADVLVLMGVIWFLILLLRDRTLINERFRQLQFFRAKPNP